jgi:two-component system OmpR family response regulator
MTDGTAIQGPEEARRPLGPEAHVLVVEDDGEMRRLIARLLRENGFRVTGARDGNEMREMLDTAPVDLILLDVMLPDRSGFELMREIRARTRVPVIMVTARTDEADRVTGLDLGADDYLTKPFGRRELLARIRAVLRRAQAAPPDVGTACPRLLRFAGWTLDTKRRELTSPEGATVDLSGAEYDLLLAFLEHPQRVLSRDQLLELARNRLGDPFDRSVDVQVSRLRRKIEPGDGGGVAIIKTVRGAGYVFVPEVERR